MPQKCLEKGVRCLARCRHSKQHVFAEHTRQCLQHSALLRPLPVSVWAQLRLELLHACRQPQRNFCSKGTLSMFTIDSHAGACLSQALQAGTWSSIFNSTTAAESNSCSPGRSPQGLHLCDPAHLQELLQLRHDFSEWGSLRGLKCQRSLAERGELWGHPLRGGQRLLLQGDLADDLQDRVDVISATLQKQTTHVAVLGKGQPGRQDVDHSSPEQQGRAHSG